MNLYVTEHALKLSAELVDNVRVLSTLKIQNFFLRFARSTGWTVSGCKRPEVFCDKGFLKSLTNFTENQLWQSLFLNKVAGSWPPTQLFSCEFWEILNKTDIVEHLWTAAFEFPAEVITKRASQTTGAEAFWKQSKFRGKQIVFSLSKVTGC